MRPLHCLFLFFCIDITLGNHCNDINDCLSCVKSKQRCVFVVRKNGQHSCIYSTEYNGEDVKYSYVTAQSCNRLRHWIARVKEVKQQQMEQKEYSSKTLHADENISIVMSTALPTMHSSQQNDATVVSIVLTPPRNLDAVDRGYPFNILQPPTTSAPIISSTRQSDGILVSSVLPTSHYQLLENANQDYPFATVQPSTTLIPDSSQLEEPVMIGHAFQPQAIAGDIQNPIHEFKPLVNESVLLRVINVNESAINQNVTHNDEISTSYILNNNNQSLYKNMSVTFPSYTKNPMYLDMHPISTVQPFVSPQDDCLARFNLTFITEKYRFSCKDFKVTPKLKMMKAACRVLQLSVSWNDFDDKFMYYWILTNPMNNDVTKCYEIRWQFTNCVTNTTYN